MNRSLPRLVVAVCLLAACEAKVNYGIQLKLTDLEEKAIEVFAAQGLTIESVSCPDEFWYREGHDIAPCTAKIGGLEVDFPVKLGPSGKWNATPQLPEVQVRKPDALVEKIQSMLGTGGKVTCPPLLWFWKGKPTASCQITIRGETVDFVTTADVNEALKVEFLPFVVTQPVEDLFVAVFRDAYQLEASVDCGSEDVNIRHLGEKQECKVTWKGGRGVVLLVLTPKTNGFILVETEGAPRSVVERAVAAEWTGDKEGSWACAEGTQIHRGQPLVCDFVKGKQRQRMQMVHDEEHATFVFNEVPAATR